MRSCAWCGWLLALMVPAVPAAESGLVGHWRFDGVEGATVPDRSLLGNHGRNEFGTVRAERAGSSLELDGLGAAVEVPLQKPLGITNAVTAVCWVRATQLRHNTVLFGIPNATESWTTPVFGMYLADQQVVWGLWFKAPHGKALVTSPAALPANVWVCLAGTYDGTVSRLYLNGDQVAEQAAHGDLLFGDQPLLIGRGRGAKPSLRGRLGELRVYNRALTAAEVKGLFDQTQVGYDLTPPVIERHRDGTVLVETHGNSPASERPWRARPTRLLELLDGYQPGRKTVPVNRYGGRTDQPAEAATGYFTTKKLGRRHWLIDPEGRRFYHVAVNAVREPANLAANFGTPERWAETVTAQLREAGFNGLGNWQTPRVTAVAQPLVWVRRHDFMFAFAREKKLVEAAAGTQGFPNRVMPVFHPEFAAFCDRYGRELATTAQNPYLLGIMTDNELQCPVDLLDRCLALDPANPDTKGNRAAAEEWLAKHQQATGRRSVSLRDRYQFIAYAFERYYRVVRQAVRKYDAHHLYLGSRLNYHQGEFDNPWLWQALAPYHDVVSVNYYSEWGPDPEHLAQWEAWAGRPILVTEWYAKAMDVPGLANTHGAGWLVRTQEDRARFYQHFTLGALETPNIVGWHFFKYLDDPSTSKALDSAGGANKGFCDVEGKPYAPLLARARAVNREVYALLDFFDAR